MENVPIMVGKVLATAMPAEPEPDLKFSKDPEADVEHVPSGDESIVARSDDPDFMPLRESHPPPEGLAKEGGEGKEVEAESSEEESSELDFPHNLQTHIPKSKSCEICMRAKMTARYHRRKHEVDPEELPPLFFGHKLRVDHLILGGICQKVRKEKRFA